MSNLYPLTFEPVLLEKVWGGRRLEHFGKDIPLGKDIGESWELADLGSTSTSGAGGGAVRSIVQSGHHAGAALADLIEDFGPDLMGRVPLTRTGDFPLLVKYLDAKENLSVQVHPSPEYAEAHPSAHLKTECWYVLEAEPDAVIYKGLKDGVGPEEFARCVEADDRSIVDALHAVPAVPGECHNLPSGTVHALGAGVLVAEVQTPSDTTYRVYDWGRKGRKLHKDQSLAACLYDPAPQAKAMPRSPGSARLCTTEFFTIDGVRMGRSEMVQVGSAKGCVVLMIVAGAGRLHCLDLPSREKPYEDVHVHKGTTVLVPAAVGRETIVQAAAEGMTMLRVGLGG